MKKILIILVSVIISINITAQRFRTVAWYNWSDPIAFQLSPSPLITGYGYYSNSFSQTNNGVQYFEYAGEYYPINSWADYYYWYVNKYWFHFIDADLYEYYYWTNNDFEMARYIASKKYKCQYYPSRIYISFGIKHVHINRLYVNSPYVASNPKHVKHLNRSIGYKKEINRNYQKLTHKQVVSKRDVHRKKENVYKPVSSNKNNNSSVIKNRTTSSNYGQKHTKGKTGYNSSNSRTRHSVNQSSSNVNNNSRGNRNNTVNRSSSVKNNSGKTKSSKRK